MCVIIYKPAGQAMPSKEILRDCYLTNRDGIGFATPDKNFHTLSFNTFMSNIKRVKTDEPCIIHFRWATHGSVKKSNCHPFVKGDIKFAHNGVLPIQSVNDKTDSEIAFDNIIYPVIQKNGFMSKEADRIIKKTAGSSRFAIMKGDQVELFGQWFKYDGLLFSNLNWRPWYEFN